MLGCHAFNAVGISDAIVIAGAPLRRQAPDDLKEASRFAILGDVGPKVDLAPVVEFWCVQGLHSNVGEKRLLMLLARRRGVAARAPTTTQFVSDGI
jgi:hypothetical protein